MRNIKTAGVISGSLLMLFLLTAYSNIKESKNIVFPKIKGFELVQDYPVYYPDNLWDYINGAADAYLEFGFVDLHIAEYVKGEVKYKAEIYKHKDATFGFGIYALERSTDYQFIDLGVQGYSEGTLVHFLKGPYYVKLTTYHESDDGKKSLQIISQSLQESLEGTTDFPELLSAFPKEGKLNNAEGFVANNFMGYSFMSEVFTAEYTGGYTLFIIDTENAKASTEILENISKRAKETKEEASGIHRIEDKYNGTLFFGECSKGLIGGFGDLGKETFIKHYKEIVETLK